MLQSPTNDYVGCLTEHANARRDISAAVGDPRANLKRSCSCEQLPIRACQASSARSLARASAVALARAEKLRGRSVDRD